MEKPICIYKEHSPVAMNPTTIENVKFRGKGEPAQMYECPICGNADHRFIDPETQRKYDSLDHFDPTLIFTEPA